MLASAHAVANLQTPGFRPLRAVASARPDAGGVDTRLVREGAPREVDLAGEAVNATLASVQLRASLRALDVAARTLGAGVDLFA